MQRQSLVGEPTREAMPISIEAHFAGMALPWAARIGRFYRRDRRTMMSKIRQPLNGNVALSLPISSCGPDILHQVLHRALDSGQVAAPLKTGISKMMADPDSSRCLRAYLITTKSNSCNGCERLHFEPLYDGAMSDCLVGNHVAVDRVRTFQHEHPGTALRVVFFVSRVFIPGPPARVRYENLDDIIQEVFADNLQACWDASAAADGAMPPPAQREAMLQCMKESLRDSVLNDLWRSGEADQEHVQHVLKSLLRNAGSPHTDGPLRSLVALKSDSFSHFAHCDENCETVKVSVPMHFQPLHMLASALLHADSFSVFFDTSAGAAERDAGHTRHILQQLGSPIIDEYIKHLKAAGFDVELAFSNMTTSMCTLKLVFPVRRVRGSASCVGDRVAELRAETERFMTSHEFQDKIKIDDKQVCLAKGFRCPTCCLISDRHSMYCYRRSSAPFMKPYITSFERASLALPEPPADVIDRPIAKGLDRGPEDITWLQRIRRDVQANGVRDKDPSEVLKDTPLGQFEIGDVMLTSRIDSYSDDLVDNLARYASPAEGKSKATVYMIKRPHMNARFIDPISIIPFLSPKYRESECHIEKDAELRLDAIEDGARGELKSSDTGHCVTFVFSLVSNFNKLTASGIANLNLPGIRIKRAELLRNHPAAQDGFRDVEQVMETIARIGVSRDMKREIRKALKERVRSGQLSFGCRVGEHPRAIASPQRGAALQVVPATPDAKDTTHTTQTNTLPHPDTPETVQKVKQKPPRRSPAACGDAMLRDDYCIPTLYPLLQLLSLPEQTFWAGSESREWRGGVLPRGDCPAPPAPADASSKPDAKPRLDTVVYSFKQLLRASYYDGEKWQCACPPRDAAKPADQLPSLLEREAETVDNFMHGVRDHHHEHGLTQQQLARCFESDPSVAETHVAVTAAAADAGAFVLNSETGSDSDGEPVRAVAADGGEGVVDDGAAEERAREESECRIVSLNRKLIIRSAFLEQCRQVVGLHLPKIACTHDGCGKEHDMFTGKGLPNMRLDFYQSPIKNPNNVDSEYDPCCESE